MVVEEEEEDCLDAGGGVLDRERFRFEAAAAASRSFSRSRSPPPRLDSDFVLFSRDRERLL